MAYVALLFTATSPEIDRAGLSPGAAIRRMAEDMRNGAAVSGCITESDLERLGFTATQIARHGAAARQLAYARAVR